MAEGLGTTTVTGVVCASAAPVKPDAMANPAIAAAAMRCLISLLPPGLGSPPLTGPGRAFLAAHSMILTPPWLVAISMNCRRMYVSGYSVHEKCMICPSRSRCHVDTAAWQGAGSMDGAMGDDYVVAPPERAGLADPGQRQALPGPPRVLRRAQLRGPCRGDGRQRRPRPAALLPEARGRRGRLGIDDPLPFGDRELPPRVRARDGDRRRGAATSPRPRRSITSGAMAPVST